jgi:hypothetical protein
MRPVKRLLLLAISILILSSGLALSLQRLAHAANPPHKVSILPNLTRSGWSASEVVVQADTTPPVFPTNPLIAPANGAMQTTFRPTFDWANATDDTGVVSYTLVITPSLTDTLNVTATDSVYTPPSYLSSGVYTWTVQAHDSAGNSSAYVTPSYTFTIQAGWLVYLPVVLKPEPSLCPTNSAASFELIPIDGPPADHPDYLHGDLNLSLRGYAPTTGFLGLVNYSGGADPNAPQLAGLFEPNRFPGVSAVYRVNDWNWSCGAHGCPGPPLTNFPVTLAGLNTTPSEPIFIPERGSNIWSNYKVMVLYAEEQRITLGYSRQDTVANGYAVHLDNVCVDPNLLALYRAQVSAEGWHVTGQLPALRNNQAFGTALGSELKVAIRDRGTFMDPRSRKDWWPGY